jgi:hypothetical protein
MRGALSCAILLAVAGKRAHDNGIMDVTVDRPGNPRSFRGGRNLAGKSPKSCRCPVDTPKLQQVQLTSGELHPMDFFVSHAGPGRAWAEWVAWASQLRADTMVLFRVDGRDGGRRLAVIGAVAHHHGVGTAGIAHP